MRKVLQFLLFAVSIAALLEAISSLDCAATILFLVCILLVKGLDENPTASR